MEIVNGTEITYLYSQGQPFAIHKKNVNETNCINYLHLDYQGSLMAITSQSGNIIEERNYDVWGRPRNPNTLEYVLPNPFGSGSPVKRGFTFHEHLEEFNLINMNGRVYDPLLARFLNADPFIQDNTDAQNFNRYSYVLNNPTKYTDPSGYAFQGTGKGNEFIQTNSYRVRLYHMDNSYEETTFTRTKEQKFLWEYGRKGKVEVGEITEMQFPAKNYLYNDGFDDVSYVYRQVELNTKLFRYGDNNGRYFTDPRTPSQFLNIPNGNNLKVTEYNVIKPFFMKFGGVNGGLGNSKQYLSNENVNWLLQNKVIEEVLKK